MILKETILSAFTERGTLLKWLKKVEAALKDSVLTDISVQQVSETQIKLKFSFEGGDYVESPVLTLPRGEQGDKGEKGERGIGFSNTSIIAFQSNRVDIEGENIFAISGTTNVEDNVEQESTSLETHILIRMSGSDSIVVDVGEDNNSFEFHIDAAILAKIDRALLLPVNTVTDDVLVGIGTNNEQKSLKPEYPLMIEDDELIVDIPEWYLHRVRIWVPMASGTLEFSYEVVNEYKFNYSTIGELLTHYTIPIPQDLIGSNSVNVSTDTGIRLGKSVVMFAPYYDINSRSALAYAAVNTTVTDYFIGRIDGVRIADTVIPLKIKEKTQ